MRRVALLCVCFACGFQGQGSPISPVIDASIDVPSLPSIDAAADAAIDTPPPPPPFCDTSDPRIIGCYPFDGDARDHGALHLDPTTMDLKFQRGKVGMAMLFAATSKADVGEVSALDVSALTIEAWLNPSQLPPDGQQSYVVDNTNQYALFVASSGAPTCVLVGPRATVTGPVRSVVTGEWHHVACTFDGDSARIYIDGALAMSSSGDGTPLSTSGQSGMSIAAKNPDSNGSRLLGLIDELRLLNMALPAAQICTDAGKTSCP